MLDKGHTNDYDGIGIFNRNKIDRKWKTQENNLICIQGLSLNDKKDINKYFYEEYKQLSAVVSTYNYDSPRYQ